MVLSVDACERTNPVERKDDESKENGGRILWEWILMSELLAQSQQRAPANWRQLINFYTVSQNKGPTLKRYSSKLYGSILMIFGRNIQMSLE